MAAKVKPYSTCRPHLLMFFPILHLSNDWTSGRMNMDGHSQWKGTLAEICRLKCFTSICFHGPTSPIVLLGKSTWNPPLCYRRGDVLKQITTAICARINLPKSCTKLAARTHSIWHSFKNIHIADGSSKAWNKLLDNTRFSMLRTLTTQGLPHAKVAKYIYIYRNHVKTGDPQRPTLYIYIYMYIYI